MKHLLPLILITLTSCQLLNKEKHALKTQSQKEAFQTAIKRTSLTYQNQLLLIDSSNTDFTVLLWPKGKFTYSLANGFEGEAEQLLIKSKERKQKIIKLKNEMKRDSLSLTANYSSQKESSKRTEKNKLKVGYSWWWLLLLPATYVGYRVYKRFKR